MEQEPPYEKQCAYCGKTLHIGRSDRVYCGDSCRNAFNRQKRKQEALVSGESMQEQIIRILKNNHRLLKKFNPEQQDGYIVDGYRLYEEGFCFNYFTGSKEDESGKWCYCFEQCWQEVANGQVALSVDNSIAPSAQDGRVVKPLEAHTLFQKNP